MDAERAASASRCALREQTCQLLRGLVYQASRSTSGATTVFDSAVAGMTEAELCWIIDAEAMVVDRLGNVWLQHYRLPWEQARVWHVLSRDGKWQGEVVTPAGVTVFEIGSDYLLGRHLDDLRVERVVVYSLRRGEG